MFKRMREQAAARREIKALEKTIYEQEEQLMDLRKRYVHLVAKQLGIRS